MQAHQNYNMPYISSPVHHALFTKLLCYLAFIRVVPEAVSGFLIYKTMKILAEKHLVNKAWCTGEELCNMF